MTPADPVLVYGESLFRALLESVPDAMVIVNRLGVMLLVNVNTETMFGYRRDELVGQSIDILVPRRLRAVQASDATRNRSAACMREVETAFKVFGLRKNGDSFPVEITISPLNTDREPLASNVIRDVTEPTRAGRACADNGTEPGQLGQGKAEVGTGGHETLERHQEAALRYERNRAQQFLDACGMILLGLDLDGRITLINRKGCEVLGRTEGELLGLPWVETCLPLRIQDELRTTQHKLAGGDLTVVENPILSKSGAERLIEWHHTVLRDDVGHVVGTLSSGTDLTERRQEEEARRTSEARYRTLFEFAPDGIVIADRDSYYIDVNASMCRMLGYSHEEFVGLHASDIVHASEIPHIGSALRTITAATSAYRREWTFCRKDGSVFVADVTSTVMPNGNLLGIIRDVSDRNQALERLRTAEERTRFALQNANVGIWDMDYTTGVLRWSEIIEAHYGLAPGTFGGTFEAFVARIHPDDREAMLDKLAKTMKAGTDFVVEHRTIWPDGTVRWLTGAGRTFLSAHGEPVRSVGISQDITERKNTETELARLNTEIQRQRLRVFKATMRTVQDIVNNLLNGLQLVHFEGEGHPSVEMRTLVDQVIREAAVKLKTLGNLETI